ncbi:phosphorylase family protein [Methylococcus capsulatus]|uniref:phosphorylase family protein n=1 Tax=Methylococcus capsulatus TaxID=414 RepID=UPI001C52EC8A|nr:phosphorylase [Methylococcus capsulatus]QXP90233.1 phosphorylase [Methylococcus capsulatus]
MIRIGVVVALPAESRTLTRRPLRRGKLLAVRDTLHFCLSGSGPDNAAKAARRLVEAGCNALVSWGCAGALEEHLQAGDLILPAEVVNADGTVWPAHPGWHREAVRYAEALPCRVSTGRMTASGGIVHGREAKRTLAAATGAEAVDMESGAVIHTATVLGLPALAIRAIADDAATAIPRSVLDALDPHGDTRLPKLVYNLARRPSDIPDLLRLAMAFKAASATLRAMGPHLHAPGKF